MKLALIAWPLVAAGVTLLIAWAMSVPPLGSFMLAFAAFYLTFLGVVFSR